MNQSKEKNTLQEADPEGGPHERTSNDRCAQETLCMWVCTCLHVINRTPPVIMAFLAVTNDVRFVVYTNRGVNACD